MKAALVLLAILYLQYACANPPPAYGYGRDKTTPKPQRDYDDQKYSNDKPPKGDDYKKVSDNEDTPSKGAWRYEASQGFLVANVDIRVVKILAKEVLVFKFKSARISVRAQVAIKIRRTKFQLAISASVQTPRKNEFLIGVSVFIDASGNQYISYTFAEQSNAEININVKAKRVQKEIGLSLGVNLSVNLSGVLGLLGLGGSHSSSRSEENCVQQFRFNKQNTQILVIAVYVQVVYVARTRFIASQILDENEGPKSPIEYRPTPPRPSYDRPTTADNGYGYPQPTTPEDNGYGQPQPTTPEDNGYGQPQPTTPDSGYGKPSPTTRKRYGNY